MDIINLSNTIFSIGILFFIVPGLLARYILQRLIVFRESQFSYFFALSIVYSFIIYSFASIIYCILGLHFQFFKENSNLIKRTLAGDLNPFDAGFIIVITILLVLLISICERFDLISRIFQFLNLTKQFSSDTVWHYLMNHRSFETRPFIYVRDFDNGLVYSGRILAYSNTSKVPELLMDNVDVYDDNGLHIQRAYQYYLKLCTTSIQIEIVNMQEETPSSDYHVFYSSEQNDKYIEITVNDGDNILQTALSNIPENTSILSIKRV